SGPALLAVVFALWSSIPPTAGLRARRWHKARAVSFSIRSQPRRLQGGDSNPEHYRKFKCRLRTNDIVLAIRQLNNESRTLSFLRQPLRAHTRTRERGLRKTFRLCC